MLDPISGVSNATAAAGPASESLFAPARGVSSTASADASGDFGSFLSQLAASTAGTLKAGEAAAIAGVNGQATAQQVVEAVMTAEQTLQTAIAIRDKVVSAFLEVSRMSI
jgi:flagellar hook-basal body complex protein FliE